MKSLVFLFSCLFGLTLGSDVMELTDSDFDSKIATVDTALVEFFAPWCGHCKKLAPEYEKAATALKKDKTAVTLVKVDCIANTKVCGDHGVSGYPTLKIFREGKVSSDYQGPRTSDGIVSYMKKQVEPASKQLDTVEDLNEFLQKTDAVVIGFFSDPEDADAKAYSKLTSALREDYTFGHTYSSEVSEKAGYSDAVVLFRPKRLTNKFEAAEVKMTEGSVSQSNVKSFLEKNMFGLCGHMTVDNAGKFKKPLLTVYYDVDYEKNPKGTNYWRNRVMKVGKEFGDLTLSVANANDFNHVLSEAGVAYDEVPVVMVRDAADKKYFMDLEGIDPKDSKVFMTKLGAFIKSYLAGEIAPKIKSEPVPESNDGPVKVVVGETFEEIVMDETKDVLIEFYAPWCGHCKSLAPKYEELGEKMKGNEDLIIAKIDATANDSPPQFAVSGFPTIYWAPKSNKQNPEKYNGGREVADFVEFLKRSATTKLKEEL